MQQQLSDVREIHITKDSTEKWLYTPPNIFFKFDHPKELDQIAVFKHLFDLNTKNITLLPNIPWGQIPPTYDIVDYIDIPDKTKLDFVSISNKNFIPNPKRLGLYHARKSQYENFSSYALDCVLTYNTNFLDHCLKDVETAIEFFDYYRAFFQAYGKGYQSLIQVLPDDEEKLKTTETIELFKTQLDSLKSYYDTSIKQTRWKYNLENPYSKRVWYYQASLMVLKSIHTKIPIIFPDGKTKFFPLNSDMLKLDIEKNDPENFLYKHLVYLFAAFIGFIDFKTVGYLIRMMIMYQETFYPQNEEDKDVEMQLQDQKIQIEKEKEKDQIQPQNQQLQDQDQQQHQDQDIKVKSEK